MNIRFTYTLASGLSAAVVAGSVSASVEVPFLRAEASPQPQIAATLSVLPLTPIGGGDVYMFEFAELAIGTVFTDTTDGFADSDAKDIQLSKEDEVVVTESTFKVFTNPIDFDPSDSDIDPTPVFVSEFDAKVLTRPDVVDAVVSVDTPELAPEKVLSDAVPSPTDAIDRFDTVLGKADAVAATEAIDQFRVTTEFSDAVTLSDSDAKNFTPGEFTASVEMLGDNLKAINSSVDFDPSDSDVDPDPVAASDAIDTIGVGLGKADAFALSDTDQKDFSFGGFTDAASATEFAAKDAGKTLTDAVTVVEGAKLFPQPVKADDITATDAITKFDPRIVKADAFSVSEAVDSFDVALVKADSVSVVDVSVKNFTENVDFDRSDADADADPVTITDLLAASASKPFSNSVSANDTSVANFTKALTDSYTVTESIYTLLTLGESSYMYPDWVTASDGSNRFIEGGYSYNILGTDYYPAYTGVIGAAETVNVAIINGDRVTYPDNSSAGLVVNFLYTEAEDTTLGGYYFNQTPLGAGSIEGGDRIIL